MKFIPLALLIVLSSLSYTSMAQYEKVYSPLGYPYELLINNTDSVKIFYRESKSEIACRVKVQWQNKIEETSVVMVSHDEFESKPLSSCLPRQHAKHILKKTFEKNENSLFSSTKGL